MPCAGAVSICIAIAERPIVRLGLQLPDLEVADDRRFATRHARTLLCTFQDGSLAWRAPPTLVSARLNGLGSFVEAKLGLACRNICKEF